MTLRSQIGLIGQPWHKLHTLCPMPYRLLYLAMIFPSSRFLAAIFIFHIDLLCIEIEQQDALSIPNTRHSVATRYPRSPAPSQRPRPPDNPAHPRRRKPRLQGRKSHNNTLRLLPAQHTPRPTMGYTDRRIKGRHGVARAQTASQAQSRGFGECEQQS